MANELFNYRGTLFRDPNSPIPPTREAIVAPRKPVYGDILAPTALEALKILAGISIGRAEHERFYSAVLVTVRGDKKLGIYLSGEARNAIAAKDELVSLADAYDGLVFDIDRRDFDLDPMIELVEGATFRLTKGDWVPLEKRV